ncbi:hypothetical protein, partial [Limosilactobacillus fastidiosus]
EGLAAAQILLFEVQVAAAKETITSAASAASSAQIAASSATASVATKSNAISQLVDQYPDQLASYANAASSAYSISS